ncbi:hypothetical protein DSECCO2_663230 [anaerobic digester metagenome]
MKEEKLGQEPAFPTKLNQVIGQTSYNFMDENGKEQMGHYNNYAEIVYQGVSKRFYAACAAMQGLLANQREYMSDENLVSAAFHYADELLRQEG